MAEKLNIKISTLVAKNLLKNPNAVMLDTKDKFIFNNVNISLTDSLISDIRDKLAPGVSILGISSADANTVTVTFNCNGGILNGEEIYTQNVEVGSTITLPTPSLSGYTVSYWLDELEEVYGASSEVEITTNKTFTAYWAESECTHPSTSSSSKSASSYTSYNCTTDPIGTRKVCKVCGEELSSFWSYGSHSWGSEIHVPSNYCQETGSYVQNCTRSNCVGTRTTRSDNTYGPHKYGNWVNTGNSHFRECQYCIESQSESHVMSDVDARSYTPIGDWAGTHKVTGKCSTCGATFTTTESCTNGPSCELCGNPW